MFTRRLGLALLLVALVCATVPVLADSTARIVRLSYLDGDVQIDRAAGNGWERAVLNMPVVQGTQLSTRSGGTAEVEFEDGSTLRLVPQTVVTFSQLILRSSGQRASTIELSQGTAYLDATTKKDDFRIATAGPEIRLTRDARLRLRRSGSDLTLAVFKGEVDVQGPNGSVEVKKSETLNLNLKDPSQYELARGIDSDSYDAWDKQRDHYRDTYAANHRAGYNSLYSYGWSDLNYFGNFTQYGTYGWLWRPFGVGPSWDPFADGAWMFYPGYGYMWVSGYPWGWMPYRYGGWQFVPGFGWAWSPGTVWTSWYAVPVIHNAPSGYVAPAPPPVTKGAHGGRLPDTVVVGGGAITDVRAPRYREWVKEAGGKDVPKRRSDVTPVPPPVVTTTSGTSTTQRTSTSTSTATTTSTGAEQTHRQQHAQPGGKHGKPEPPQEAAPAPTPSAAPPAAAAPGVPGAATTASPSTSSGSRGSSKNGRPK